MIRNSPPKRKRFYDKVWAKASRDLSKPPKPPKPIGSSSDSGSDEEPEIIPFVIELANMRLKKLN